MENQRLLKRLESQKREAEFRAAASKKEAAEIATTPED